MSDTRSSKRFTLQDFGVRLLVALVLVGATYNPETYSYYHWAIVNLPDVTPTKAVAGILLLIGWVIFVRATFSSLGAIGLVLVGALCGSVFWLLHSWGWVSPDSPRALIYVGLFIVACILATGMSWSFIRRRFSGQLDVDDVED